MDINTCFETTNSLRSLAFYAHLVPALVSLVLGFFALRFALTKNKAVAFATFAFLFAIWLISDMIVWLTNDYYLVAAIWSTLDYVNITFFLALFYFLYNEFFQVQKAPVWTLLAVLLPALFPFLITVAGISVVGFDQPNCEMYENELLSVYKVVVESAVIALILLIGLVRSVQTRKDWTTVKRVLSLTFAAAFFMGIFAGSEFIATITDVYEINLYALFALPIFVFILTYTITEQDLFLTDKGNILSVQLLFLLFLIVGVMDIFLADSASQYLVSGIGVIITLCFGVLLLKSANREKEQRERIEKLAKDLERANVRLRELDKQKSEFVSIASHQLRSPLTAIRGYASMLVEGSYGSIPEKAVESAKRIEESAKLMALSIEDYLNVSRIESGNMKYVLSDFNLKDMVDKICDDLRPEAMKKGLVLLFRSDVQSRGIVNADVGKTNQIIHNLINNSLKYTPKGSVNVLVRDDISKKRIYVDIIDTGIGMSQNTIHKLFQKFSRADNANATNVSGTGLGLYVAQRMAQAMGGDVTCSSEGDGKGSTFTFELPLAM